MTISRKYDIIFIENKDKNTKEMINIGYLNGYKYCYMPNHPNSYDNGIIYEHILKAEEKIGRYLKNDELKELIRNKSFVSIGKYFGVSDNAIRKWCDSYSLPRKSTEIRKISDEDWGKNITT